MEPFRTQLIWRLTPLEYISQGPASDPPELTPEGGLTDMKAFELSPLILPQDRSTLSFGPEDSWDHEPAERASYHHIPR